MPCVRKTQKDRAISNSPQQEVFDDKALDRNGSYTICGSLVWLNAGFFFEQEIFELMQNQVTVLRILIR